MTPEQKDTYINLLENFKNVIVKNNKGWRLDELAAIKAIEEFENGLPCNQEGGLTPLAPDVATVCPEHGEPVSNLIHFSCGCFVTRPAGNANRWLARRNDERLQPRHSQ